MITADSPLLSPPRATARQAQAYVVAIGSVYTPGDIATIMGHYWRYCIPLGLDPLLAVAQCIHETSDLDPSTGKWRPLSSWWAQRPRRNPAGIGVTGEVKATRPDPIRGWVEDTRSVPPIWRAGLTFPSWEEGARAHIGRLLAFALKEGQETEAQREAIGYALALRPLSRTLRGTAPTPKLLGARHNPTGLGWATPGDKYGEKIALIAQSISMLDPDEPDRSSPVTGLAPVWELPGKENEEVADNSTDDLDGRRPAGQDKGVFLPYDEDAAEGPPSRGDFKYIGQAKTAEEFTNYVQSYDFGGIKPDYIVLHHTAIPGASYAPFPGKENWDANEDGKSDEQIMAQRKRKLDNIKSYYAGLGWDRGPHLFIDDRYIWLFTPMYEVGYHAKEGNMIGDDINLPKHYSLGIEVVGYYEHIHWPPQVEQLVRHAVTTLQNQLDTFQLQLLYPNGRKPGDPLKWGGIASHRNYNKKECPGAAITEQYYMSVLKG